MSRFKKDFFKIEELVADQRNSLPGVCEKSAIWEKERKKQRECGVCFTENATNTRFKEH